jgi:hypothetical protein
MKDLVELVDIISALEEWTASKQLGKNAAYRPNIDYLLLGKTLKTKNPTYITH